MENRKINVSSYVIDYCVFLCIQDAEFLRALRQNVPANTFGIPPVDICLKLCYDFFDEYQKAPQELFLELVKAEKGRIEVSTFSLLLMYLKKLSKADFSERNKDYILDKLNAELIDYKFCANQEAIRDLVNQNLVDEAKSVALSSFQSILPSRVGAVDYLNDFSIALGREYSDDFLMSTGIEQLDALIGGYKKQNFIVWFGGYKGGKTWGLQHVAKTAISFGLNVYHASFEVPQAEMQIRYDQMFGRLTNFSAKRVSEIVMRDDEDRPCIVEAELDTVYNHLAWMKARENMAMFGGRIFIEKFHPYTGASILDIEDRLLYFEQAKGIKFDVVITDYADIMKPLDARRDTRDQLNITYMLHKMLADKYNCLVITASQVQRSAIEAPIIKMSNLAEDIRKAANADGCIAICRTPAEKEVHFKKIFVAGGRSFEDGVGCGVYDNLKIGQFCEWSVPMKFFSKD